MAYFQVTPGQTVTSSHMNTVMNQGLMSFATAAARNAAISAPVDGMMCYLADTGTVQQHNGFVWVGDTAWQTLTLLNGWVSVVTPQFRMDHRARVTIQGAVDPPASNAVVGNIGANYKPATVQIIPQYVNSGTITIGAALRVDNTIGELRYLAGTAIGSVTEFGLYGSWQADFKAVR
jgi:hypothetical protein